MKKRAKEKEKLELMEKKNRKGDVRGGCRKEKCLTYDKLVLWTPFYLSVSCKKNGGKENIFL